MPLLKRKRLAPVQPPPYDANKKESRNSIVWYSPLTKEIFKDYSYPFLFYIVLTLIETECGRDAFFFFFFF
jgi:hypothetical protein